MSLSLPLWRGQYSGARDAARANVRMLEYETAQARNELQSEAEHVLFELRDAARRAELYGSGLLPKARQALEATARAFQTGNASFLDYMDAQLEELLEHDRRLDAVGRGQRVQLESVLPDRQLPVVRGAGDRRVSGGCERFFYAAVFDRRSDLTDRDGVVVVPKKTARGINFILECNKLQPLRP